MTPELYDKCHCRARERRISRVVTWLYWILRLPFEPTICWLVRGVRVGREHVPAEGAYILAMNHRSAFDILSPITMVNRPLYYIAKLELFKKAWQRWLLPRWGAVPADRGSCDGQAIATSRRIVERGDPLVVYTEGQRVRHGPPMPPKSGAVKIAFMTGVPIIPVMTCGSERIRHGKWPKKLGLIPIPPQVQIWVGEPIRVQRNLHPTQAEIRSLCDRIHEDQLRMWQQAAAAAVPVRQRRPGSKNPKSRLRAVRSLSGWGA